MLTLNIFNYKMLDPQKNFEDFLKLEYNERKAIVIYLLKDLIEKNSDETFINIHNYLENLSEIDEELVNAVYENIIFWISNFEKEVWELLIQNLQNINKKIEKIREKEKNEIEKENPDNILKSL